jgi:hypothetical protein
MSVTSAHPGFPRVAEQRKCSVGGRRGDELWEWPDLGKRAPGRVIQQEVFEAARNAAG